MNKPMTMFHRAATIAVMTLTMGLFGASARTQAHELTTPIPVRDAAVQPTALTDINAPTRISVPDSAPIVTGAMLAAADLDTSFDSLADAVAAHDDTGTSDAARCLAGAIYFESKGEPLAGQLAVAEVILNRSRSGRFPRDICGVVTQRGQFSFVRAGRIPSIDEGRAAYRTALAVARVALAEAWNSPARKALYFNTPGNPPAARLTKVAALGNHVFYR
jgi:spore germination cell wall hydrolase CwlJ-like protein